MKINKTKSVSTRKIELKIKKSFLFKERIYFILKAMSKQIIGSNPVCATPDNSFTGFTIVPKK
ncbi:MAG: hypothetical protein ACPLZ9_01235 [Candidatus Ratteibacteria bacterium]